MNINFNRQLQVNCGVYQSTYLSLMKDYLNSLVVEVLNSSRQKENIVFIRNSLHN